MSLLMEQRELLRRFKEGDRSALEEVYRYYVADVASFLSRGFTFQSLDPRLHFTGYTHPSHLDNTLQQPLPPPCRPARWSRGCGKSSSTASSRKVSSSTTSLRRAWRAR